MAEQPRKKNKIILAFCGAVLLFLALVIGGYYFYHGSQPFLVISGLDDSTEARVVLEEHGKAAALNGTRKKNSVHFDNTQKPTPPYILSITMQNDAIYRDVRIVVNDDVVRVIAEGFTPKAALSFGREQDLHFDWSGRIELQENLNNFKGPICLETQDALLCHTIPKAART